MSVKILCPMCLGEREIPSKAEAELYSREWQRRLIPAIPELAGHYPVVLWFKTKADAQEFEDVVRQAKPGMITRQL